MIRMIIKNAEGPWPVDPGSLMQHKVVYKYDEGGGRRYYTETQPEGQTEDDGYEIYDDEAEIWVGGNLRDFGYLDAYATNDVIPRYGITEVQQKFGITEANKKDYAGPDGLEALPDGVYSVAKWEPWWKKYVGYNG